MAEKPKLPKFLRRDVTKQKNPSYLDYVTPSKEEFKPAGKTFKGRVRRAKGAIVRANQKAGAVKNRIEEKILTKINRNK